jgi:hypothetical protein
MIWPLRGRVGAFGLGAIIAAASTFGMPLASAHNEIWYEKQCCDDKHCEPIADGVVQETSKGFKVPSGELLPFADGRVRQSHDMRFHWCHAKKATVGRHREFPSGNPDLTICLYVPPKSF